MPPSLQQPHQPEWDAILSRLVAALRKRFPEHPDPLTAEDAATSAIRTLLRQMQEGQQPSLPPDELLAWLVGVGFRKYANLYRHDDVERRHAESVGRHAATIRDRPAEEEDGDDTLERWRRAVDAVYEQATPEERIVLDGKREGRSQAEIADAIARTIPERKGRCSQPTVSRLWQDLCARLQQKMTEEEANP
jgi:hypothetical protein